MVKLIGIFHEGEWQFENRQLPLDIDESLTMVMKFNDMCANFDQQSVKLKTLEQFGNKYDLLSTSDVANALQVSKSDLFQTLAQTVSCVGCRRSVERLFNQLSESGHPALYPLVITMDSTLTVSETILSQSRSLCELFHILGTKLNSLVDAIPKNKKNRRCLLHSLESQRSKPVGNWVEVWDLMSKECRDEVVLVESDVLLETLESYLRKHRFCGECKSKVMRAYNILIGRLDASKEKGYASHLYKGIHCYPPETHVHVLSDSNLISRLITRAEPEFRGNISFSNRERHAKTVENAQEEVLTCLGICLYERLHRIWQRLHEEEQTWQILFHLGVNELRKNFELAVEKKQGYSQLELVCEEIRREELVKQQRLEQKRLKRKKKKNNVKALLSEKDDGKDSNCSSGDFQCEQKLHEIDQEVCVNCNGIQTTTTSCHCGGSSPDSSDSFASPYFDQGTASCCSRHCSERCSNGSWISDKSRTCYSESGYCSANGNESSSSSSSENSEIASNEGFCDHEHECNPTQVDFSSQFKTNSCQRCSTYFICRCMPVKWLCNGVSIKCCMFESGCGTSLQDMLEESSCTCDDNEEKIPPEEMKEMKAKLCQMDPQRQELRKKLRQRFANFRQSVFLRRTRVPGNRNSPCQSK